MTNFLLLLIWLELTGYGATARYRIKLNRKRVRWILLVGYVILAVVLGVVLWQ